MNAVMMCLAMATLGTDAGWQRLPDGRLQYIIQMEPQTLDALRASKPVESDLPSNLRDVRSYRIVFGSKKLPRDSLPDASLAKPALPPIAESQPAPPHHLSPDPTVKPLVGQQAVFKEPTPSPAETTDSNPASEPQSPTPAKPWLPLTFTLLGLFASFGGNIYLGWIVLDLRKRCRSLLGRHVGTDAPPANA
jgi:hypothetical protein